MVDLHIHSNKSDGTFSPRQLARMCQNFFIKYAALTDHDTIAGQQEFLYECSRRGVNAISGVEFSAEHPHELHILGYAFDIYNKELNEYLKLLERDRYERALVYLDKLNHLGFKMSLLELKRCAAGGVLGRPHIAQVMVQKGYARSISDAFVNYLDVGQIAYCNRKKIAAQKAIELIKNAGGHAVLAHPSLIKDDIKALLPGLASQGLEGLEVYYTGQSSEQYLSLAQRHGLFATAGSDFHGLRRPGIELGELGITQEDIKSTLETFNKVSF